MKKFIIAVLIIAAIIFGLDYAFYHYGFYININPEAQVTVPFRTSNKEFQKLDESGEYEEFIFKGVDITASMPGHYGSEYYTDKEDYLRWFELIGQMGANSVRALTVMDDDFYDAIYTYNTEHEKPLYLLQGISVSDTANYGYGDAYEDDFYGSLLNDGLNAVDIIHGKKSISAAESGGTGIYRHNISEWVAGYMLGSEWGPDVVSYTNHNDLYTGSFSGTYFYTDSDANAFEAMLAQVMDRIIAYENDKYHVQRPIGFVADPSTDLLVYEESYARQLLKYCCINSENVKSTDMLLSGQFAPYRLYDFCDDFSAYLDVYQNEDIKDMLVGLDDSSAYGGYLEFLSRYHTMPVIAAGYGFSSSRGITRQYQLPLTEEEQGKNLIDIYEDALNAQWSGVFISTWQDTWERRSWNTGFAAIHARNYLWHDLQTESQCYGLLAFDPGEEESVCVIDGNAEEWSDSDLVLDKDGTELYCRYDQEALFILVQGDNVSPNNALFIPIDTTQESGSKVCHNPYLTFDREADFILCLDGFNNSRLTVQERYDATRENFNSEITGVDPFIRYPSVDTKDFVTVYMALDNENLVANFAGLTPEERKELKSYNKWETGRLVHGNGDSNSSVFNSLADFCYGENCAEIRIPWLLINVGDPSSMAIHSDYYVNYGVDFHTISKIWLGITDSYEKAYMQPFKIKGLGTKPKYHERLKKSYYVVQNKWAG